MYATVSLRIELDASASLSDMESQIQQAGREAMKEALNKPFAKVKSTRRPARSVEASRRKRKERSAESC